MDEKRKLEIRRNQMYSEWKRFWDFWHDHPTLDMNEALSVYNMNKKKEEIINNN